MSHTLFPFVAILGQERMKLGLLLNVIDPQIGGILIRGEKGTGKSTAARALAAMLPKTPFATLPLNATEDMVLGGLDFSETVRSAALRTQFGLLSRVNHGILFIDEVNLLDDHLVDVILDAAASGENVLEREGVSSRHPCRFTLVGTMNPEEGSLRPQLLDRFGLCVEVAAVADPAVRVRVMEFREGYEQNPASFADRFVSESASAVERILWARRLVLATRLPDHVRKYIADLTLSQNVAGHRAYLVIARAACAYAAWEGRTLATISDVVQVAEMALSHRRRETMPPPPPSPPPTPPSTSSEEPPPPEASNNSAQSQSPPPQRGEGEQSSVAQEPPDTSFDIGETFKVRRFSPPEDRLVRRGSGRRTRTRTSDKQGRYVRSRISSAGRDLALDATLRAAAPHQHSRGRTAGMPLIIRKSDWRDKERERRIGTFILFVVDASGSMGARGRMVASKGAVMSLLLDAYQKRDRIGMITFRRHDAWITLPPTSSIEVAGRLLRDLPVGGRTPLSSALAKAYEILTPQLHRNPDLRPMAIVVTDGKANVALAGGNPVEEALGIAQRLAQDSRIHWTVVDTEDPRGVRFELARRLALALQAEYFDIEDLRSADLLQVVKGQLQ